SPPRWRPRGSGRRRSWRRLRRGGVLRARSHVLVGILLGGGAGARGGARGGESGGVVRAGAAVGGVGARGGFGTVGRAGTGRRPRAEPDTGGLGEKPL